MSCGLLRRSSRLNCNNPLQGGADPNVILINHKELLNGVISYGSVANLINDITLEAGATGYLFEGIGRSTTPTQEVVKLPNTQNTIKHSVAIYVFEKSQEAKNMIQDIIIGKFAAIVKSTKLDQNAWELYGLGLGLEVPAGVINNANENNGAYTLTLATPDNMGEVFLPNTIYDETSVPTTQELVNGLLYLPAILNISDLAVSTAGGDAEIITGQNFFGGGTVSDVSSVVWVNQSTLAETAQTGLTVSDTEITFSTVALTAGTYALQVTTSKGIAVSKVNVVAS